MRKQLIVELVEARIRKWENELADAVDAFNPMTEEKLEKLEKRRMEISQAVVELVQKSS